MDAPGLSLHAVIVSDVDRFNALYRHLSLGGKKTNWLPGLGSNPVSEFWTRVLRR